ncbi:MAG: phage holin family protein [Pseudomonadota bacterium]|nr:phage holin family protein [Pseudomonadota bacterium]MEE2748896.1 phage holin family protein [Pseudomonadota bacterium]
MTALDLLIIWFCILSIGRLITYRRDGARFKRHYGIVAWVMICCFGALAIHIIGGRICSDKWPILLPITMMITLALFHTRGNVAQLVNLRRFLHD